MTARSLALISFALFYLGQKCKRAVYGVPGDELNSASL